MRNLTNDAIVAGGPVSEEEFQDLGVVGAIELMSCLESLRMERLSTKMGRLMNLEELFPALMGCPECASSRRTRGVMRRAKLLRRFAPLVAKSMAHLRTSAGDGGPARKKARVAHDASAQMIQVHGKVMEVGSALGLQGEQEEFRSAIATMEKTVEIWDGSTHFFPYNVEISDGSTGFFPLLVAALGGAQSCAFFLRRFEAVTGLTLIPDGDKDDSCAL